MASRHASRSLGLLAVADLCAGLASIAHAQTPPPTVRLDARLPNVVVSATRVESSEDDVAAKVTVITDKDIERLQPGDVKDLLKYEAGISVRSLPNRSSAAFTAPGAAATRASTSAAWKATR